MPKLAAPAPPKRVRISQGVTRGLLIQRIEPSYPPLSLYTSRNRYPCHSLWEIYFSRPWRARHPSVIDFTTFRQLGGFRLRPDFRFIVRTQFHGSTYRDLRSSSDEELMRSLRSGQHDALAVIVDRYQRLVWSVAQKIVHDEGEAEDVVQIVFLELFRKKELFDPRRGTLKVWLLQLAYTRSINRRYHLQRRQFYNQVELEEEEIARFSPEESLLHLNIGETDRLVRQLLDTLNPSQKAAIQLIAFNGMTFQELAARMGESVANAKHHYYRGMMRLRECLSSSQQTEPQRDRSAQKWEIRDARAQSI